MDTITKHIETLRESFITTAPRHPVYEDDNSIIPNVKYIKTKENEAQILEYLSANGFSKYDDYSLINEDGDVFVQMDEADGRTYVYFIQNLQEQTVLVEQPTTDVAHLAEYFGKIADALNTKAVSMKGRNQALSDMYKAYHNRFNHLEAQAQLNRKDRVVEDFQKNADEDMIGFIHSELTEEEFNDLAAELEQLGLPIK